MSQLKNFIQKHLLQITFILFIIGLFIGGKASVISLVILILHIIYSIISNKKSINTSIALILLITFYIWHIIGYFYSLNKDVATFDFEVKFSIFLLPLLLIFFNKDTDFLKLSILKKVYLYSSLLFSSVYFIHLVYKYILTGGFLNYYNFSTLLHPTYYAMYIDFSIIIALNLLMSSKRNLYKLIYSFMLIIFLINIYFTDSKAGLLATTLILAYSLVYYGFKYSKIITSISLSLFIISSIFILQNNGRFKHALNTAFNFEEVFKHPENAKGSTSVRILAWDAGLKIITKNKIIGVGAGDIKDELLKKYEELNYKYLFKQKLNVHNQFLETWLGQGLIGLAFLLLLFILPFITAIKQKDIILQSFLILIFTNFLFESMLNTQSGVIFFAFFYSLLVLKSQKANT